MTSIYEIKVSNGGIFGNDTWLFEAESLAKAVAKAESKIRRGRRRYENWKVVRASTVYGIFCK
jgi:hypothetical protein